MIRLGLTGSIGTGKSTTARMFAEEGLPVNDADEVVHQLYCGEAVPAVKKAFPESVLDGCVDRQILSGLLAKNPARFHELEAIVHPLVVQKEREFLLFQKAAGADIAVLDIPLLFETGANQRVDKVVVVTCDPETQRHRVMARPGMTEEKLRMILSRQMPDEEKRRRADYVIDSGRGMADAKEQVRTVIDGLRNLGK
ncbi:dephospho-CoA kinase [Ciceribacter sp. L1K23]|uniref:dephospho-CoA kinase n=1 Tax=Ciceribacter sp. L1K23 TaxID=2820276 RepID=UPI001B812CFF|nr:dephospho-CoA kinase [Ciceribacter sp. L1K23]MBR0557648.1 dephospho-CoA kinase [Ciceribacter sp. L1K23]